MWGVGGQFQQLLIVLNAFESLHTHISGIVTDIEGATQTF